MEPAPSQNLQTDHQYHSENRNYITKKLRMLLNKEDTIERRRCIWYNHQDELNNGGQTLIPEYLQLKIGSKVLASQEP